MNCGVKRIDGSFEDGTAENDGVYKSSSFIEFWHRRAEFMKSLTVDKT